MIRRAAGKGICLVAAAVALLLPVRARAPAAEVAAHCPRRLQRRAAVEAEYPDVGDAPVSMPDAATGKTLRTFEGSAKTEEIIHHKDTLLAVLGDRRFAAPQRRDVSLQPDSPAHGLGIRSLTLEGIGLTDAFRYPATRTPNRWPSMWDSTDDGML